MSRSELTDTIFGELKYTYTFLIKNITSEPVEKSIITYLGRDYEVLSVRECIDIYDNHEAWRVAT